MKKTLIQGNNEDTLLTARIEDAFAAAEEKYETRFIGFLDMHMRNLARKVAGRAGGNCQCEFYGGYQGAERMFLGVFPPYSSPAFTAFPISCIEFEWKFGSLTHRDFLGALLSAGLRKEKIGDILVEERSGHVFLDVSIAPYILQNLKMVGGTGVRLSKCDGTLLKRMDRFGNIADTVASPRLDCVAAALIRSPRAEAERLVTGGLVSVDFETEYDRARTVNEGATVSIRGHGRFIIDAIGPRTKKGRYRLAARKYL